MAQVQKCFGDLPENVVVLSEVVSFDSNGFAEVSDEVAEILVQVPGYKEVVEETVVEETNQAEAPAEEINQAEAPAEETNQAVVPKKPAQRRTSTSR